MCFVLYVYGSKIIRIKSRETSPCVFSKGFRALMNTHHSYTSHYGAGGGGWEYRSKIILSQTLIDRRGVGVTIIPANAHRHLCSSSSLFEPLLPPSTAPPDLPAGGSFCGGVGCFWCCHCRCCLYPAASPGLRRSPFPAPVVVRPLAPVADVPVLYPGVHEDAGEVAHVVSALSPCRRRSRRSRLRRRSRRLPPWIFPLFSFG